MATSTPAARVASASARARQPAVVDRLHVHGHDPAAGGARCGDDVAGVHRDRVALEEARLAGVDDDHVGVVLGERPSTSSHQIVSPAT